MKEIVEILKTKKQTISTMESCTGGAIVNEITNIEGASNVIKYSAITYSNEFKISTYLHFCCSRFLIFSIFLSSTSTNSLTVSL